MAPLCMHAQDIRFGHYEGQTNEMKTLLHHLSTTAPHSLGYLAAALIKSRI